MDQRTELAALRIAANKLLQACDVVPNGSLSAEFVRETFKDSLPEAATALQSSGGEVVAGKWRQLTTADEVKAALDAKQAVEWTSNATDSIDMPGNREPDAGGWIPHTKNHYTEDRLFKIGRFRAFITASPAQPSGFVLVPVEPTAEMLRAGGCVEPPDSQWQNYIEAKGARLCWALMLTAAPAPIEQEG